jgi:hypothetical protein
MRAPVVVGPIALPAPPPRPVGRLPWARLRPGPTASSDDAEQYVGTDVDALIVALARRIPRTICRV